MPGVARRKARRRGAATVAATGSVAAGAVVAEEIEEKEFRQFLNSPHECVRNNAIF